MASFTVTDKMIASVFLLVLFNVNQGQCYFYPPPAIGRPQGQQQPLFEINEPPNRVGYSYNPSWAEVHLQPFIQETPHHNQQQPIERIQQQLSPPYTPAHTYLHPSEKHLISSPKYSAHTLLHPSEKYHISPPKYQWSVQPSIYHTIPSIGSPLIQREPQQQSVNVLLPIRVFGVQTFPPFLERLIQRVQTYYSIYNPPDTLTIPHSPNTPPTFTASSLLPPFDTYYPIENNENNKPGIDTNTVENNEETTELNKTTESSEDTNKNNETGTEESTAAPGSPAEDSTKAEIEESKSDTSSNEETATTKKSDENDNETTTAASISSSSDNSENTTEEQESTGNDDEQQISSTEATDNEETTASDS